MVLLPFAKELVRIVMGCNLTKFANFFSSSFFQNSLGIVFFGKPRKHRVLNFTISFIEIL